MINGDGCVLRIREHVSLFFVKFGVGTVLIDIWGGVIVDTVKRNNPARVVIRLKCPKELGKSPVAF